MTVKQALQAQIEIPVSDIAVEKVLIDEGVDGTKTYAKEDEEPVDLCLARLLLNVIMRPASITEGGFTLTLGQRDDFISLRSGLLKKWGIVDTSGIGSNDQISSVSPW